MFPVEQVEVRQIEVKGNDFMVLGVDPGMAGGLCWIDGTSCATRPMPQTPRDVFECLRLLKIDHCFIEKVHSMPRQGVASTFKFGFGVGVFHGLLTALGIPYEEVTPQKWMKALGCMTRGDKSITRLRAQQLFPDLPVNNKTADAILIAHYGRRKLRGTL